MGRDRVLIMLGAVVCVLLQFGLVPVIALSSVQPDILLVYVLIIAVVCPANTGVVLPFVLGFIYDLTGFGPVGGMAFLFVFISLIAARAFIALDNDTLFIPLTIFMAGVFIVEILYGVLFVASGFSVSVFDAIMYRVLPCALYDCAVGFVLYPIMMRLITGSFRGRKLYIPRLR